ncbi:HAD-IA family hydrolase [Clostridium beijerinckii]|uniref:HAD-IA family hydrolase n=1 Tax=Clostridium beijerinckii TaxID=1520 RepID=UPI00031C9440|nr:HAD-IA family hydrolase [Clostridium beijerinckii]
MQTRKRSDCQLVTDILKCNTPIVAFDFFDTIVHRDCNPEEILYEWAKICACYFKYQIEPSRLYSLRKEKEREGKRVLEKEELTYEELMRFTFEALDFQWDFDEFYQYSLKEECRIELKHISLDKDIILVFKSLKNNDKKIVVISDFYSGFEIFEGIIRKLGIEKYIDQLYVSSNFGVRKSTGNLYKKILEELRLSPDKITMVGDNKNSDYKIPQSLGLKSVWKQYKDSNNGKLTYDKLVKLCKKEAFSFPEKSPLSGYVPEILYFVSDLYASLIRSNISTVFFCSREGQLLKELFDLYQKKFYGDKIIKTYYLFVSRKSTLLPSLGSIESEKFERIFRQYKRLSVQDFLNSLMFSFDEIQQVINRSNIKNTDYISVEKNNDAMNALKNCDYFVRLYNQKRNTQKQYFMEYIESFKHFVDSENCITIVDIGWKGTIQDSIYHIILDKYKVRGYYLGLMKEGYAVENMDSKHGVLFSDTPMKCDNFYLLQRGYMFYERIFAANHGPVVGYEKNISGEVYPVVNNDSEELRLYSYIKEYQEGLVDSFMVMLKIFQQSKWEPYELYDMMVDFSLWKQCVHFPKIWRIEKTARNMSRENFGDISKNDKVKVEKVGEEQFKKKDYYFVDYTYRLLERYHIGILKPFAAMYCRVVYLIKKRMLQNR